MASVRSSGQSITSVRPGIQPIASVRSDRQSRTGKFDSQTMVSAVPAKQSTILRDLVDSVGLGNLADSL